MSAPQKTKVSPRLRRARNLAKFWQQRYEAVAHDHGELARVSFDRARAAATRAARSEVQPLAMYDLARLLTEWAERLEEAEAKAAAGHTQ